RKETCYVSGMKRAYRVYLTELGREKAEALEVELVRLEEKAFKGFTAEERLKMLKQLAQIEDNLRE
ncbi:MAG: hypothetical protein J6B39_08145, partial [Lachnospiraceae bacterium]|nr:hypothetical protein [Lachnospiraceae bacterium]